MMEQYNLIYLENNKLDDIFHGLYDNYNKTTIEKNIVELLVELGELANETRCFKYWSNKKPSDKAVIMDEYADCILMVLCFFHMKKIELNEDFETSNEKDMTAQFKILFNISSQLDCDLDNEKIKRIFSHLINLGKLLNFSDEDIVEGCIKKINRNKERFETGF